MNWFGTPGLEHLVAYAPKERPAEVRQRCEGFGGEVISIQGVEASASGLFHKNETVINQPSKHELGPSLGAICEASDVPAGPCLGRFGEDREDIAVHAREQRSQWGRKIHAPTLTLILCK